MSLLKLPDFAELGTGHAFGSVLRENVVELTLSNVESVGEQVRRDVAVFDWWVRNEDRVLTNFGGNVNLLWDIDQRELVVIDYNLAFDDTFDSTNFLQGHVFAKDWNDVFQDFLARPAYETKMRQALEAFDDACDKMPDEWLEIGPGVPSTFLPDDARRVLDRIEQDDFWNKT